MDATGGILRNFSRRVRKDAKEPADAADAPNDGTLTHRSSSIIRLGRRGANNAQKPSSAPPAAGSTNLSSSKGSRSDSNVSSERGDDDHAAGKPNGVGGYGGSAGGGGGGGGGGSPSGRLQPGAIVMTDYAESEFDRLESNSAQALPRSSSASSNSTATGPGGRHVKSPLFASGTGMMTTDVSDSFKRAFQQMATEREVLREELLEARRLAQEPGELKKQHEKLQEDLEEAQAAVLKERGKSMAAAKSVSELQKQVRQLNTDLAAKSSQVDALKAELESGDKKSIQDLLAREKAAESALLRKGREIDELQKAQAKLEKRLQDSTQDSAGLQNMADRAARKIQKLEEGLRSESQKRIEADEARERADLQVSQAQAESSSLRLKLDEADRENSRMEREVRALHKGLESAKGEGSDAASKVSELERLLSLRTDEVAAAEKTASSAEKKMEEATIELLNLRRELVAAQQLVAEAEEKHKNHAGSLARESENELSEARSHIRVLTRDLEREREMAERDRQDYLRDKAMAVDDMAAKAQEAREGLATAKVELSRTQRDLALSLDQAQDSAIAKEREIKSLTARLEAASADVEDAKWHLERANAKAADIKSNAKAAEDDLKSEIHETRGRIVELQASTRDAERRALDAERAVFDAKNESTRLADKLKTVSDDLSNLRDRNRDIERDMEEACNERDSMEAFIAELELTAKRSEEEHVALMTERDELKSRIEVLEKAVEETRREAGDAQSALLAEHSNVGSTREKLVISEQMTEELKKSLAESRENLEQLKSKTANMEGLQSELEKVAGRTGELERSLADALANASSLEKERTQARLELDEVSSRLKLTELARDSTKENLRESEARLLEKQESLDRSLASAGEFEKQLEIVKAQLVNEGRTKEELKSTVERLEQEQAHLHENKSIFEKNALSTVEEMDDLKRKLAVVEERAREAEDNLESASVSVASKEAKLDELRVHLDDSLSKMRVMEQELEEARSAERSAEQRATKTESTLAEQLKKLVSAELEQTTLRTSMLELSGMLSGVQRELDVAMSREALGNEQIDELRKEVKTLSEERDVMLADMTTLRNQSATLEDRALNAETGRSSAELEHQKLQEDIKERESDLRLRLAELETTRTRLAESQESVKSLETAVFDSETTAHDLTQRLEAAIDAREAIEGQIELVSARMDETATALQRSGLRVSELENEAHALRIQLSEKEDVEKDRAALQRELEAIRAEADAAAVDADAKISALILEQNDLERARRQAEERANTAASATEEVAKDVMSLTEKLGATERELEEACIRVRDFEAEITEVTNTITELEWSLNEQTLRADSAEEQAEKLREQGRTIYAQIEEFGEEAEARIADAEMEVQAKVEDIAALETRIDELCDEAEKQKEDQKRLEKELESLRSDSREKESARGDAERKLDSITAELRMERDRARNHEMRINELTSNLAVANAAETSARENLLRLEERMRSDVTRMRELEGRADRLAMVEEKLDRAETERARARAELSMLVETKSALELKLAQIEMRRYEEVDSTNRKSDQELIVYRDQNLQRRPSVAESSSSTRHRRSDGKNGILVGASAFAGGLSIFALKLLAKAATHRD